jgi:hypothetical protein
VIDVRDEGEDAPPVLVVEDMSERERPGAPGLVEGATFGRLRAMKLRHGGGLHFRASLALRSGAGLGLRPCGNATNGGCHG